LPSFASETRTAMLDIMAKQLHTCESAKVPTIEMKGSCRGVVFYSSGRTVENITKWSHFSLDSWEKQEGLADSLVNELTSSKSKYRGGFASGSRRLNSRATEACKNAAKTFACATHFPYCPYDNSGVAPIPVCQQTCVDVKYQCSLDNLDCSSNAGWRSNGNHCFQMPDGGSFLLSSEQGPYYYLPTWYLITSVFWTFLLILWCYLNFRDMKQCSKCHPAITARREAAEARAIAAGGPNRPRQPSIATRLHRFMLTVPFIKLLIVWFAAAFWIDCAATGLCSFWMGVFWVNMQLIYETSYILIFVLISKGWCITTAHLSREQWRSVLMSVCTFYMAESMLLVFKSYMQWSYWLFTALLYMSFLLTIFKNTQDNVSVIQRQLDHADNERLNVLGQLLLNKLMLLRLFQYILICYTIFELLIHTIFDAGMRELNTTIIAHETMEMVTACCLGYIICPNVLSRLYYQGLGPQMNATNEIIPFFQATLRYKGASKSHSTSNVDNINSEGKNELTATMDEAGAQNVNGSRSRRSSSSSSSSASIGDSKDFEKSLQKSTNVRRLSKLSKIRRLSKSSVSVASPLRSSLVSQGEMKEGGARINSSTIDNSPSDSTNSNNGGSSVVQIKPVHRPKWLLSQRNQGSEEGNSKTETATLVIVQNPSRVDIQMAARCRHTVGSYRMGIGPRSSVLISKQVSDDRSEYTDEDTSDSEDDEENVVIMRGRSNSSERRGSTNKNSYSRAVEMTTLSRRPPPPPPPPPTW
jgi:hypothetical protein